MTVTIALAGVLNPPKATALSTTNETDVFAPTLAKQHTVYAVSLANVDTSNACRVTLRWSDGSTSTPFFIGNVAAGETLTVTTCFPMPVSPGADDGNGVVKKLTAQAANANDVTVNVSYTIAQVLDAGRAGSSSAR